MKKTTKIIIKLMLLGIITGLCCSCGASLNSMKDADDYVKANRLKWLQDGKDKRTAAWTPKVTVSKDSPGSIALLGLGLLTASVPLDYIATAAYTPTTLIGIPEEVKNQPVTGNLMMIGSYVSAMSNSVVLSRKEPGKPEWDLGKEAIKRIGDLPVRHAGCIVKKFDPKESVFNTEYKGEDGEVVINDIVFPKLWVYGKRNVEPVCTMEDLLIYKDYMLKLTAAVAHIIKENNDKLDNTIFQEYPELKNKERRSGSIYWYDQDTKKGWTEE